MAIDVNIENEKLVLIILRVFTPAWKPLNQGICACAALPSVEELWDIFGQEKTSGESISATKQDFLDLALPGR